MTFLRGDLTVKQSKVLIKLYKTMKDYIVESKAALLLPKEIDIKHKDGTHFTATDSCYFVFC